VISNAVGNMTLLFGLTIIAYQPLVYIFVGVKYELDKPMTDSQAVAATKSINKIMLYSTLAGYSFVLIFLINVLRGFAARHQENKLQQEVGEGTWGENQESQWIDDSLDQMRRFYKNQPGQLFYTIFLNTTLLLCSCLEKYYLTGVAGFDWMVGRLVNLRRIERDADEKITKEYTERMDQMLSLISGKNYKEWVKDEWKLYAKKVEKAEKARV